MKDYLIDLKDNFISFIFDNTAIFIGICIFVGLISFIVIDISQGKTKYDIGIVIDKEYTPEHEETSISYTYDNQPIYSTYTESAKYSVIVRSQKGNIDVIEYDINSYYNSKIGETVRYKYNEGYFTGVKYCTKLVNRNEL